MKLILIEYLLAFGWLYRLLLDRLSLLLEWLAKLLLDVLDGLFEHSDLVLQVILLELLVIQLLLCN